MFSDRHLGPDDGRWSCPCLTGQRLLCLGSDELPWGAHFEPGMRMVVVVVLEPSGDLPERGDRVRQEGSREHSRA